ncbi:MAG: hypothetical protein H0Z28_11625 [Archaeoglobus sp.]|nr:hypothetical protein [Archaeoglobus sp.]
MAGLRYSLTAAAFNGAQYCVSKCTGGHTVFSNVKTPGKLIKNPVLEGKAEYLKTMGLNLTRWKL